MSNARHDAMMRFLNSHITAAFTVESLAGDASFRRYHRIHIPHADSEITYLLMDAPPEIESVDSFLHVADIMSETVNVPDIIAQDVKAGFLLLQDFGTVEFAHLIADDAANKDSYYTQALKTLAKLQTTPTDVELAPYSTDKLSTEINLFSEWFLPYLGVKLNDKSAMLWQTLKDTVNADIAKQPKVIVHRDYHSRNLMADKGSDALGVIDFQDALIGAYTYDLVSLVRDAYINYDENWVNARIGEFHALIKPKADLAQFTRETNIMGVQRHLKVLGIFIRLSERDGKHRYLDNIPKVMNDLVVELEWLAANGADAIYGEFLAWLNTAVMPAYNAKFIK